MVNLFFEIKRKLPTEQQSKMRLSDSDIGNRMTQLYKASSDDGLKALIEAFLERAGDGWLQKAKRTGLGASLIKTLRSSNDE